MPLAGFACSPVEETIHGVVVPDPFRLLEDRSAPETEAWIRHQKILCGEYFLGCKGIDAIQARVREYLDVEVTDQPVKIGGHFFYRRRNPGEEQGALYTRDALTEDERCLVDPSGHGPLASVGIHRISDDGSLLAYDLRLGGSDQRSIHLFDVQIGRVLPDQLSVGFARGFSFAQNNVGFFYCHETDLSSDHIITLHLFGGPDQMCFRRPRAGSRLILVSDTNHLGAIYIRRTAKEEVLEFSVADKSHPYEWRHIFTCDTRSIIPILEQSRIFGFTNQNAPNGRIVEFDRAGRLLRTVIPEQDGTVRQIRIVGDKIFLNRLIDMEPLVECWNIEGRRLYSLDVPLDTTAHLFPDQSDSWNTIFYSVQSYTQPPAIFEHNCTTGVTRLWNGREHAGNTQRHIRKTTYTSFDKTKVPITLSASSEQNYGKSSPVLMTSYGGFGISMTPQFSVLFTIMMELGLTVALPSIRGGREFGQEWHNAARGKNRQVAIDDFNAAAEWLCSQGMTTPKQLAIIGGSNSGLLVAAAMTQQPKLFRAVVCIAPILDMVRYEILNRSSRWQQEYGSIDDSDEFRALYAYSPYHRVEQGIDYPAVLFVSGDRDDRCNPAHVRKMAARLQDNVAQRSPVIVDYSEERGHSPTLPMTVRIEALTRRIAFLSRELGIPVEFGGDHDLACA